MRAGRVGLALDRRYQRGCAGDDGQNLNREWVVLRNDGGAAVDLTGWGVKDESASNRYRFPDGFVLDGGATVETRGC